MAAPPVPDPLVDRLQPRRSGPGFLTAADVGTSADQLPSPLLALCAVASWSDARLLAAGAVTGVATSTDHQGFGFSGDATVVVVDPLDREAVVSLGAFRRLMGRLLGVLVERALADGEPVTAEDWWPELVGARDALATG